ncbi:hypothetical protein [Streptomyces sp. NPDC004629]|uniref:hypothetical protein n=1 Tax=Streptomyces sp. NPDC004629 TaxID=3364705 RepID=UPI003686C421
MLKEEHPMHRAARTASRAVDAASALTLTACGGSGGADVAADVTQTGSSYPGEFADMGALEPVGTKAFNRTG